MEWVDALNNAIEQTLPPREEMTSAIVRMLAEAPFATKKAVALYIYDAGYQFQDTARGCIINAKKLSDTAIAHIYNTLVDSTTPAISISDISLE